MDLFAFRPKQKLYITKTIFYLNTNMVSEFKVIFPIFFFCFWRVVFTSREQFTPLFQLEVPFLSGL